MVRTFKLIAYDKDTNAALDEILLPNVTSPSGIGFKQKVTVQETDTIDYVVRQVVQKKDIKLTVNFIPPDGYEKAESFQNWLGNYLSLDIYKLVLEYSNGMNNRLVDIYISDYELIAQAAGVVGVNLTIKPLSPNYITGRTIINIHASQYNKTYPYSYPYRYGGGALSGNSINNRFIAAIPLCVTLRGRIVNPEVSLISNGSVYAKIKFSGLTLAAGATLVIDGINQRIIHTTAGGVSTDYFNEIDKDNDTFLMAKPGESTISANLDSTEESNPNVEISYVQYVV